MFIRAKKRGNRTYHYLVESYREGGKTKQRVVGYLGRHATLDEAIKERAVAMRQARNQEQLWLEAAIKMEEDTAKQLTGAHEWAVLARKHEVELIKLLKLRAQLRLRPDDLEPHKHATKQL